jgi:3-oxoacyl-[acyl-carrier protein] reductase
MSLTGKVALITGSSNGIGRACVERLAKDGASVIINYRSDQASAEALALSIGSERALAVQADAGSLEGIDKLVAAAVTKFGHIDFIMANAGIMVMRTVENTTEDDFRESFRLNVQGPYFLAQVSLLICPLY